MQVERREATALWDHLQTSSKCCGVDGPNDWNAFRPSQLNGSTFPRSCCHNQDDADPLQPSNSNGSLCADDTALYRLGCAETIVMYERGLLAFGWLLVFVQLALLALTCCVTNSLTSSPPVRCQAKQEDPVPPQAQIYGTTVQRMSPIYPDLEQNLAPPRYGSFT